ncbi:hypothetical protein EC988_003494, partial [Linderina pennispora]
SRLPMRTRRSPTTATSSSTMSKMPTWPPARFPRAPVHLQLLASSATRTMARVDMKTMVSLVWLRCMDRARMERRRWPTRMRALWSVSWQARVWPT